MNTSNRRKQERVLITVKIVTLSSIYTHARSSLLRPDRHDCLEGNIEDKCSLKRMFSRSHKKESDSSSYLRRIKEHAFRANFAE